MFVWSRSFSQLPVTHSQASVEVEAAVEAGAVAAVVSLAMAALRAVPAAVGARRAVPAARTDPMAVAARRAAPAVPVAVTARRAASVVAPVDQVAGRMVAGVPTAEVPASNPCRCKKRRRTGTPARPFFRAEFAANITDRESVVALRRATLGRFFPRVLADSLRLTEHVRLRCHCRIGR